MRADLAVVEARYCAESVEFEAPDPDLIAVFAALRAALAVTKRQEASGNTSEALRASRVRWAVEQHISLNEVPVAEQVTP